MEIIALVSIIIILPPTTRIANIIARINQNTIDQLCIGAMDNVLSVFDEPPMQRPLFRDSSPINKTMETFGILFNYTSNPLYIKLL